MATPKKASKPVASKAKKARKPTAQPVNQDISDFQQPESKGTVRVTYGMTDDRFDIVGLTVAQARKTLKTDLNISEEEAANVNGEKFAADYKLQADDHLEFVKFSGSKA